MKHYLKTVTVLPMILFVLFCTTLFAQDVKVTKRVMTDEEFDDYDTMNDLHKLL